TQIDEDDIEEIDIKWNMALLSLRANRFWKKTVKMISIQGTDVAGFDKSKVKCFNCHKMGHFARECRAPRSQDRGRSDNYRQRSKVEEQAPKALMAIDGVKPTKKSTVRGNQRNWNNLMSQQLECIVSGRDFKLTDDTNVLLRTPRQHNMYSIDLNNIVLHKDLTCLVAKASTDECMLWHRRLGKFDSKGDEGYFIRYSMSSKAFRVFNKKTKRVEENLHVDFLQNKPIEKGAGLNWLFDINSLINSMNYVPVVVAGTNSTNFSGTKEAAGKDVKKDVSSLRYIVLLNWFHETHLESSTSNAQEACNADDPESSGNFNPTTTSTNPPTDHMETSHLEPKKIFDALQDPSRVEAIKEELLQFKIQNVWSLVDCPKGFWSTARIETTEEGTKILATVEQYTRRARIAQSLALPPVADEPASPIGDDNQGEACPTDSGLEADQDRENIPKTSTLPNDSTPRVTSLAADEGSLQQKLDELTYLCTSLQRQQSEMISKFAAQELEINMLKAIIKLLEDKDRGVAERSGDDALIKGRRLDEGEEAVKRVSDDTEEMETGMTLEEIKEKFDPVWKQFQDFIPISSREEAERFKRKGVSYWKIVRLGGSTTSYQFFVDLLKHFDRKYLNQLWALVKETLNIMPGTSDKKMELWVELKRLYEPDVEDQLWTHTQNLMHDHVEWKLYDTCLVHHVTSKDKEIFMLVEKDYPLRKGLAIVMISYKLQVENYSQMVNDLILTIYKISNCPRQQDD
nr:ribonuclease H-like domain-containing protein [Tanacetum cinerariifolium]